MAPSTHHYPHSQEEESVDGGGWLLCILSLFLFNVKNGNGDDFREER